MSVYASKRKKSNVQFLDTAMDLWRYSRAKALKFPKRRTFYGGARINELAAHCGCQAKPHKPALPRRTVER